MANFRASSLYYQCKIATFCALPRHPSNSEETTKQRQQLSLLTKQLVQTPPGAEHSCLMPLQHSPQIWLKSLPSSPLLCLLLARTDLLQGVSQLKSVNSIIKMQWNLGACPTIWGRISDDTTILVSEDCSEFRSTPDKALLSTRPTRRTHRKKRYQNESVVSISPCKTLCHSN